MTEYKELTSESVKYLESLQEIKSKMAFDTKKVLIGYDIYVDCELRGMIAIVKHEPYYCLEGHNTGYEVGAFKAIKKIIKEYDALEMQEPLHIIRDVRLKDIGSLYKRFGFYFLSQEQGYNVFRRDRYGENESA